MAKRLSDDEKNKIIYMYTEGKGVTEIAKVLGRADSTISHFVRSSNLKQPASEFPEIRRHRNYTPYSCDGCIYRKRLWNTTVCDFLNMTGDTRGCPVEKCTKYSRGI